MRTVTTKEVLTLIANTMKGALPDKFGVPLPNEYYDLSYYAPYVAFLVSDTWDVAFVDDEGEQPVFVVTLGDEVARVPVPEDALDVAFDMAAVMVARGD